MSIDFTETPEYKRLERKYMRLMRAAKNYLYLRHNHHSQPVTVEQAAEFAVGCPRCRAEKKLEGIVGK